jgi:MFS superfamily sulfate permease-like transporter
MASTTVMSSPGQDHSSKATIAIVLAIIALACCGSSLLFLACSVPALILAALALSNPRQKQAASQAYLSICLSIATFVCAVLVIIIVGIAVGVTTGSYRYRNCYTRYYSYSYYRYYYSYYSYNYYRYYYC